MKKVERDVCQACGANWFPGHAVNNVCPACKGPTKLQSVSQDDAGVIHSSAPKPNG